MERFEYGDPDAPVVLIQPVGDHDLPLMEKEASLIREMCGRDFRLVAL